MNSIQRAAHWLIALQSEDGSFGQPADDLRFYYKTSSFLGAVGYFKEAIKTTVWIKHKYQRQDGDFRGEVRKSDLLAFEKYRYLYPNGWIVSGAHRLSQYDISIPGVEYILRFQDMTHGGIYSCANDQFQPLIGRMDIASTCSGGMAMLTCGKIAEAMKGGNFLIKLLGQQPDLETSLYFCFHTTTGLVMDFKEDDAPNMVVLSDRPNQAYWIPGFAMGYLGKLYQATGEFQYLEAAQRFYEFYNRCQSDRFASYASGKAAWGSSILYQLTGESKYLETALKVVTFLIDKQLPDGQWLYKPVYQNIDEQPIALTVDLLAEMAYWLCQIVCEIAFNND